MDDTVALLQGLKALEKSCICTLSCPPPEPNTPNSLSFPVSGTINSFYSFIQASSKRHAKFQDVQERLSELRSQQKSRPAILKHFCETSWASQYEAIHAVKDQFCSVLKTLEEISENDPRVGEDALNLLEAVANQV